ncbi:hypothetical protein CBQ28_21515 [Pseudoalteromonas sp. GCY]|uniref:restriction endonuclease subunit S n=1 Tax=Pseudoalteromonas sp. GCY TaxID=2003316 RepID=UPI000BFF02B0|nr:restriction endonuclease subunit S [Pseudoalteromonas sp. GCY]PHI35071.1 hypothetical protein CBQ28_21515 [Pseudoalteromonas sp. GCY]QQQ66851.1 restriction endonuclease subunit S [Pseudoalteromonas sp. GCY]
MKENNTDFKNTRFGFLPIDWDCLPLGELVHDVAYGSSAKSSSDGSTPVLRMGNMQDGFIDWTDLVYTSDELEIKKYKLEKNTVLFNRTNTVDLVGKAAIYKGERPAIYAGYLIKINNKPELLNAEYLNYILNTYQIKSYNKLVLSVAVSQANINGQKLKTYPIPVPPNIEEQKAIANALSDVDALLTELEKLIAKKQTIKTATMQQLLTGKTRLPQFATYTEGEKKGQQKGTKPSELGEIPEDWDVITIDEALSKKMIIDQMDGNHGELYPKSHEFSQDGVPYVGATDFYNGIIDYKNCKKLPLGRAKKFKKGIALNGDILFAHNATVGPTTLVETEEDFIIISTTATYYRCDNEKLKNTYLLSFFKSDLFVKQFSAVMSQSTRNQVPILAQRKFYIAIPSIEEQTAIAAILSDMDNEIQTLEQRLAKTRQIKQGMMQALLTGRIRLPFNQAKGI